MKLLDPVTEDVPLEQELVVRVGWFIQLRWLMGLAVLLASVAALALGWGGTSLLPVGVSILAYNAAFMCAHRRLVGGTGAKAVHWRIFTHVQILLDWVALTILSGLTGGLESPFILAFTFHVLLAAMLLSRRECLAQTTAGLFLIAAMASAGLPGTPFRLTGSPFAVVRVYGDDIRVLAYVATVVGTLYTCAFLASSIAERLRRREHELLDAKVGQERLHAEMALLHELAKSVNATLDLDTVLQRVAEGATSVTQAKACSIRLLGERGELQISASYGLSEPYLQKGQVDLVRSAVDRKALLGEPVLIDDVAGEDVFQYPEELAREGIRSMLCIPLMAQETALGIVRVYGSVPSAFGPEDVRFMQHFASLATIAISNARTCRALQDVNRERSRFVRMVAHELRSPLSAIMGNLRIIMQGYTGPLPDKAAQLLERAHHRGNLLLALVSDLLALVAGKEAPAQRRREVVSLAGIARQIAGDLAGQAQAKSIALRVDADGDPCEIAGDRDQIIRLVDNLVSNAVKYTPDGGRVRVALSGGERSVEIVVEDTGIGIPREAQGRLFEEFFRAENAKRMTEQGTGLGLAITRRIAEEHGGKIALESEEGRGTRVTVVLPRRAVPDAAGERRLPGRSQEP